MVSALKHLRPLALLLSSPLPLVLFAFLSTSGTSANASVVACALPQLFLKTLWPLHLNLAPTRPALITAFIDATMVNITTSISNIAIVFYNHGTRVQM